MSTDRYPPGTRVSTSGGLGRPLIYAEVISDDGRRVTMKLKSGKEFWKGRSRVHRVSDAPEEPERTPANPAPIKWRQMGVYTADELEQRQPLAKPRKRIRHEKYLRFVRTKPCFCCDCREDVTAHHEGPRAVGTKTDDLRTVPFRWDHHDYYHRTGLLVGRPGLSKAEVKALIYKTQVDLLVEYFGTGLDETTTEEDIHKPGTD